jgi:hypothetical protein
MKFFLSSCVLFLLLPLAAWADGWWGEGYRDKSWVLRHGGSIVNYSIKGKAKSDSYKARMYLMGASGASGKASEEAKKGDVIEIEYGSKGEFDDAINNAYKVIVFRGTEKKISTEFFAKPGEIVDIHFDLYEDKVYQSKKTVYQESQIKLTPSSSKYVEITNPGVSKKKEEVKEVEEDNAKEEKIEEKEKVSQSKNSKSEEEENNENKLKKKEVELKKN